MQYQMTKMPSGIGTIWIALRNPIRKFDPLKDIERFTIDIPSLNIDLSHLSSFAKLFKPDWENNHPPSFIPSIYPASFVYPVMLRAVSMSSISIPMIFSMVNIKNQIYSYRAIRPDWTFSLHAGFTQARSTSKGVELDFTVELNRVRETIWQNIFTLFFKKKKVKNLPDKGGFVLSPLQDASDEFSMGIDAKLRKNFCRLIGDRNAIHTNRIFARFMGYKDAFSQPFQALGELLFRDEWLSVLESPGKFYFEFKGPLYYNENTTVKYSAENHNLRFDLYSGENPRPGILGVFEKM